MLLFVWLKIRSIITLPCSPDQTTIHIIYNFRLITSISIERNQPWSNVLFLYRLRHHNPWLHDYYSGFPFLTHKWQITLHLCQVKKIQSDFLGTCAFVRARQARPTSISSWAHTRKTSSFLKPLFYRATTTIQPPPPLLLYLRSLHPDPAKHQPPSTAVGAACRSPPKQLTSTSTFKTALKNNPNQISIKSPP